jgi:hypothetical protein
MFFFITNVVLDIGLGASYWILKQTSYGMYSLYLYLISNNRKLIKECVDEEPKEKLEVLYKRQQDKIDELNNNIEKLTKLVETKV